MLGTTALWSGAGSASLMHNNSLAVAESPARSSDQLRLLIGVSEAIARHRDLTTLFRDLAGQLPSIVPLSE